MPRRRCTRSGRSRQPPVSLRRRAAGGSRLPVLIRAGAPWQGRPRVPRRSAPRGRLARPAEGSRAMCRNIRTLHNFQPPATDEEVRAAALQFVRKISGCTRPAKVNQAAFERAVDQVSAAARELLDSLVANGPPRNRETEAQKARARAARRFDAPAAARAN